jgi:hypothetical protein
VDPLRRVRDFRSFGIGRSVSSVCSLPVGFIRQDITVVGRDRGQVLVENLKRAGFHFGGRLLARSSRPWSATHPISSELACAKRMREEVEKSISRRVRNALERRKNAQESIGPHGFRPVRGTGPRREQSPGAAGHRELLVLRARARDVRNGRRAQASKGVRLYGGEKLCRVNPMSGTGPRDRKA